MVCVSIIFGVSGCGSQIRPNALTPTVQVPSRGSQTVIVADWTDVVPAAIVAASQVEMAIVRQAPDDRDIPRALRIDLELVTLTGEPVVVEATREPIDPSAVAPGDRGASAGESVRVSLVARVGRFGSPGAERRLLEAMSRRLLDLRGVEFRPVR